MKRSHLILALIVALIGTDLYAADTLKIAACDRVAVNMFGDMICLSQETGILRRYVDFKLQNTYQSDKSSSQPILQDPGQPVYDGADLLYLLDFANNTVIAWDRFLNIYSITNLDMDLVSPRSFTVTSEHDWLIYDDFYGQILQILPGENFQSTWGDKQVSGNIDLYAYENYVVLYLIDLKRLRISDANGTTLKEYDLPPSVDVQRVFPLNEKTFALAGKAGIYIWKPAEASLRYLSDMKNAVYCQKLPKAYRCVSREGVVVTIP